MPEKKSGTAYPAEPVVNKGELPDPFAEPGAADRVSTKKEWAGLSKKWLDMISKVEYGGFPPKPGSIDAEVLCHNRIKSLPGKPRNWSYRINCHGGSRPFSFCARVIFPESPTPAPAIINGDGCWWNINCNEILKMVLESGCALVIFNRTEMAEDLGYPEAPDKKKRAGGLYDIYPGMTFGAISAWAWGFHRCVDLLQELPFIDKTRIAVTGHSRGGKTALLAGASDKRIAVVNDNASCAAGSPVFRYVGDGGETLDIINSFPSWFDQEFKQFMDKEEDLPFDQHCLLASVAPRPLLLTYALDDRWSNPEGMVQSAWAAGEVYRFLGCEDNLAFHLRPGGHTHSPADWKALLDFLAWKWRGETPGTPFNAHPYTHLRPSFSWKAPE